MNPPTTQPSLSVYFDPVFGRHDTGLGHPESAFRLDAALEGVRRAGFQPLPANARREHRDTSRIIAKVHSDDYSRELEHACLSGREFFHSYDNPISSDSYAAARAVVSLALHATSDVWDGPEGSRAFVVARPPGHHALATEAMGFCFFNTIACVAESLLERDGIERVFVFDWDVHHGNGTQELFETRQDVFYASMHHYPFYPGTGAASERGRGAGDGFTRNVPLEGASGDAIYLDALERIILPAIDEYEPHAILLSAGFDAHYRDPLGGMRVTENAFGEMTRRITEAAARHGGGRILSLLEGGYDPEGLAASVQQHAEALAER